MVGLFGMCSPSNQRVFIYVYILEGKNKITSRRLSVTLLKELKYSVLLDEFFAVVGVLLLLLRARDPRQDVGTDLR